MDLAFELPLAPAGELDFGAVPDRPGVFMLWFAEGPPYIGRSAVLRRRLKRLLRPSPVHSRWVNLREVTRRACYQPTGSDFESALLLYRLAHRYLPQTYRRFLKLRPAPLVKAHLGNPYPRTYITTRLTRSRALFFGPFLSRASAEKFESAFLDLFKIRRCQEDLVPDPAHPGCIYGEMDMCLRPCQARVTREHYHAEVGRVLEFLHTGGQSLIREIEQVRDQSSASLEFEQAARHHRRLQKVHDALRLKDELARDLDQLYGVVIQASVADEAVELWVLYKGFLQPGVTFRYGVEGGRPVSLDSRLREILTNIKFQSGAAQARSDHLALLSRWYYSSWRQGEAILFDGMDQIPYRRLVRAVSRVAAGSTNAGE